MPTKVVMEALSPTMEEGRLVEWKKAEGDAVATGDVLAEVETDKAVMELVARADGVLLKRVVGEGETVPVAEVVGWIGQEGEEVPGDGAKPPKQAAAKDEAKAKAKDEAKAKSEDEVEPEADEEEDEAEPEADEEEAEAEAEPAADEEEDEAKPQDTKAKAKPEPDSAAESAPRQREPGERVKASPVARRIAEAKGLDLSRISGSGPEGRIVRRDVEDVEPVAAAAPTGGYDVSGFTDVGLSQMRKAIARRLVQSIGPIPTFYLTAEADMERAAEAREALLERDPEAKFSFNDIIIRACASALRHHPWVNAWWQDDHVRQWHDIHVGVAVAIDEGLITPIVRHADRKSLREIAAEVKELAGRARAKKLQPDEYTGATFSVSNLGMFGIDEFTAIINPPEAAILAVGRIEPKPVVVDGEVVVRRRMRMTLSCDHRVIDGATGAQFLKTLVGMLENPLAMVW